MPIHTHTHNCVCVCDMRERERASTHSHLLIRHLFTDPVDRPNIKSLYRTKLKAIQ